MAATRLLRMSTPLQGLTRSSGSCSSDSSLGFKSMKVGCLGKVGFNGEKENIGPISGDSERKLSVAKAGSSACLVTSEPKSEKMVDLALLLEHVTDFTVKNLRAATKLKPARFNVQMFIEKVILDCRFFTLLAVAGSLLASLLCFVQGCAVVLESYYHYFNSMSLGPNQGHVVELVIEGIDMFLVGTAMLMFGTGIHVIFVRSNDVKGNGLPESNFFSHYLKMLPTWTGMQSVMQAKSKIGHAVIMILQVGLMEKFKSIPLVSGLDLACFAGAVFVSSASMFLLSRLTAGAAT